MTTETKSYYRRQLFQLALPAMLENILQILMGITDSYLVARLGLIAVSGVAVAGNIITVYQALFIALGAAVSSLVAKYIGKNDKEGNLQLQADSIVLTCLISLALGLLSTLAGASLLGLLGTSPDVTETGRLYLAIVGGGSITLGLMTTLGAIHRAQGRAQLPMWVSLVTNLLNALLSALAITVFDFGLWGIAGATVLSRLIGLIWLGSQLPLATIGKKLRFNISRDLLAMTLPTAGERLMMRAGDVAIIALIISFGTKVVAGNSIGETLTQFNYMPGMGIATGTIILVAKTLGHSDKRARQIILRQSYIYACLMMFATGGLVFLLGPYLNPLFTSDKIAQEASRIVMFFSFIGGPATAGTLIYTALWQGLGKPKLPFYATTIGMWGLRIVLGYYLGHLLGLGLAGVWLATILDNLFRWLFLYWRYKRYQITN